MLKRDEYIEHYEGVVIGASISDLFNGIDEHLKAEIKISNDDYNKLVANFGEFKDRIKQWALEALDAEIAEKFPETSVGISDKKMAKVEYLKEQHRVWAENLDHQVEGMIIFNP